MIERGTDDYRSVAMHVLEELQWPNHLFYSQVVTTVHEDYDYEYTREDIQSLIEDLISTGFVAHDPALNTLTLAPFPPVELLKILDTPPPPELGYLQHDILKALYAMVCASEWQISSKLHEEHGYPYLCISSELEMMVKLGYLDHPYWDASQYHLTEAGKAQIQDKFRSRYLDATGDLPTATTIPPRPAGECDYSLRNEDCPHCLWDAQYADDEDDWFADDDDWYDEDPPVSLPDSTIQEILDREQPLPSFEIPSSSTTTADGTTTFHYAIDPEPLPYTAEWYKARREAGAPEVQPVVAGAPVGYYDPKTGKYEIREAKEAVPVSPEVLERAEEAGKAGSHTEAFNTLFPTAPTRGSIAALEEEIRAKRAEEEVKPGFPADYNAPTFTAQQPYPSAKEALALAKVLDNARNIPRVEPAEPITVTDPTWEQVTEAMPRTTYTMERMMEKMANAKEPTTTLSTEDLETVAASAILGTILLEKLQVSPMGRNLLINILKPWVEVKGGENVRVDVRGGVLTIVTNSINESLDAWVKNKCDEAVEDARAEWDDNGY